MGIPGGWELLVIAIVVLLLFGGKKIPEFMKGLGKGVKNFKDGINGVDDEKKEEVKKEETNARRPREDRHLLGSSG